MLSTPPPRARVAAARRVVVKIGTAVLTDAAGGFHQARFSALCAELAEISTQRELIVVSSGAIALGVERLHLPARPRDLPGKQAAAAVGQTRLMHKYEEELSRRDRVVAQILLTREDVTDRRRYLNARQTLAVLLGQGVVPIINENDTVSAEEIQLGDNDALASLVVGLCDADLLVLLSDVEGLYTHDPRATSPGTRAELISEVEEITADIEALAGGSRSGLGTGGMASKVSAAKLASETGALAVIASGHRPGVLSEILAGAAVGTLLGSSQPRLAWLAQRAAGHS